MAKKTVLKIALLGAGGLLALGVAAPFVDAEGYRARIQSALEGALGRKVKVGKVRFNLLTGPGFNVEGVEIADDPAVGIEPMAYVDSLEARVTLGTLFTQKLAFSNLKLKQPTLNLVKSEGGAWNFQLLTPGAGKLPPIQVREGRINFKFGDTKSVFYLSESDLDVTPLGDRRMDVRFVGQPARTDQAAQSFGMLLARGVWTRVDQGESQLDVNAEMEPSAVSELARLIEGHAIGLHGLVSSRARISGPVSKLAITGQLKLEDVHRWDLSTKGGALQLKYKGQLDLVSQKLDLETEGSPETPFTVRVRASELLSVPRWASSVELREVPAASFVEAARHMGAPVPDAVEVQGKLSGAVGYSRPGGFQGQLAMADATVKSPGAPVMKFRSANVILDGTSLRLGPSTVETEDGQGAELTAEFDLAGPSLLVKIDSAGMDSGELRKGAVAQVPVIGSLESGVWKGSLSFRRAGDDPGRWTGEAELRNARLEVAGLAEPVLLTSASVSIGEDRISVTRMRGRAGEVRFAGEFRREPAKPDRLNLDIPEAGPAQLERLLMPALRRGQGLFARLRLRAAPLPDWLKDRRLEGTVKIGQLTVDNQVWQLEKARLAWNGPAAGLSGIVARRDNFGVTGQLTVNLAGGSPRYRASGKIAEFEFKSGGLEVEGRAETRGTGPEFLANAHAEGTFEGQNVAFSPEIEFGSIDGAFDWTPLSRFRLKDLQATQGLESYIGQGAVQADGTLLLDLSSGKRQVKVAGTLFGPAGNQP